MLKSTDDLRIREIRELRTPAEITHEFPRTDAATRTVLQSRHAIHNILHGTDDRLVVVVGPCSIHDPVAAIDYARRLLSVRENLADRLEIVMRVYFEKPRTTVGWKGLINDPGLDGSFEIDNGLRLARSLLLDINNLGMPAGCEFLDMTTPQYFADLVAWGAIGARTTESQVHRELASGLSCPVGFKNGTDGNVRIALDAVKSASQPHHFPAVTKDGRSAIASTTGNDDCHIILRGGKAPNFGAESVEAATDSVKAGIAPAIMIDASHANSSKNPENQPLVLDDVGAQIAAGDGRIIGVMIESNLVAGRQDLVPGTPLTYGQSITDGCIGWETTVETLDKLALAAASRREGAQQVADPSHLPAHLPVMQIPASLRQLPNQLTVARILAIPVICLMIVIGWDWLRWLALLIYVAAAVTDWLDGFLARRMSMSSDLGKMLDPIADKLLVGALLVTFAWTRDFSGWELIPAIAILIREIFVSGLREYMGSKAISVPVTFLAKWKTTAQLVALFFVIVDGLLPSFGFISGGLLWLAAALTVWTGWQYLMSVWVYFDSPPVPPADMP